jgi:translation initiation factor 2 alpha subunit (eIF-2alpha)
MNEIKDYNTNLVTMDAELFKQIKILATQLNKDQNNFLEKAAHNLIKKYGHFVSSLHLKRHPDANLDDFSQTEMLG